MRVLGLDGGIASIGWAVLERDPAAGHIVAAGVWAFDAPETDKDRTPTNAVRRAKRGLRRVIRRKRQRMAAVRRLLAEAGLLPGAAPDALRTPGLDPWTLRAQGLERKLNGTELAVALGHIAAHRGFQSNSKRDRGANAPSDTAGMLQGIAALQERLAGRTVGQMLATDPAFRKRKRNRGSFDRTVQRSDLRDEVSRLFSRQRALGSGQADADLEARFVDIAFSQRPLQDSENRVGPCPFEPNQQRTARRAYSFELFRLLSRLTAITVRTAVGERRLTQDELARAAADFGRQKGITYHSLRRLLDLSPATRFAEVTPDEEAKRDVAARAGSAAEGSYTLRSVVRDAAGDAGWRALLGDPIALDRIAEVLTFRESFETIRAGLVETGIETVLVEAIMQAAEEGRFAAFRGAAHISAKAARKIVPHLRRGLVYSEACEEAGYDPTARPATMLSDIRNPVARKALGEMLKQVRVLAPAFGPFDAIHVELARDVGRSAEERDRITRGIEDRNKQKDRRRAEFADLLGRPPDADELLRYELWREQNMRCLYTDTAIPPQALVASDSSVQVDHILPWSRFGDDSFANKTLCLADANQRKQGRTPYEWFMADKPDDWPRFEAGVEGCRSMKGRKKRGFYLRRNAAEVEQAFRNRNLGDTRYATRLLLDALTRRYGEAGRRTVLARPGEITAKLRRAWGLEGLKKDPTGARLADDRHHALDALVIAATSEAMLQHLTNAFKEAERLGLARQFAAGVPEPWPGFRQQAEAAVQAVFVARPERGRARGEAHAATIRQVRHIDGEAIVFERKPVEKLTLADLDRIPVPAPYGKAADPAKLRDATVTALRAWIEADRPKDALPCSPKGDVIRKVRVPSRDNPAIAVRGGTADRGEMARVDVFRTVDAKGRNRFHLVPIYPHQVASAVHWPQPPDRAVVAYKSEEQWTLIGPGFEFLFSLHQNSLVEAIKPGGEVISGYFKGLDRSTGAIRLASIESQQNQRPGIGAKTLLSLRKHVVDRLGRVAEVPRETRTWHGAVCT